ncbi:MAG: iron-containing alcohol dehydrogenase [Desulfobacterales bacterium]|nr:iron-containing alcohol dehydrogenase [Desulfobacterales bacterium]
MPNNCSEQKKYVVTPAKCRQLCTCGQRHPTVDVKCCLDDDAFDILANDCHQDFPGGKILIVDDDNTHPAAGRAVVSCLKAKKIVPTVLTLTGPITATETLAEQIFLASQAHDLIVAVGAGTINDLCKYAAGKRGLLYWTVPTAASMNGYTSAIAAIKISGVKRTLPSPPPQFVYAQPDVIHQAPPVLRQAGYFDFMAKSVSDIDWQIESLLFSGSYCRLPDAIVMEAARSFLNNSENFYAGHRSAAVELLKALLVSGAAMSLAGSSAPASGGEHLFSHFLDMREFLTGKVPALHGLQVACGIILSAACYQQLQQIEAACLKGNSEKLFQKDIEQLDAVWASLAEDVKNRFSQKQTKLLQLELILPQKWDAVKALCGKVRHPQYYLELMRRTGHAMTLEALNISENEYMLGALTARAIRERITVLDIAAQAGVLEKAAREAMRLLQIRPSAS